MSRDLKVYIEDIFESLEIIADYVKDIDEEDFSNSIQIQDAVIRRFEIIGEAAKQVPDSFRKKYPKIPWRKMAGLRDALIHQYFGVSIRRVWKMIKNDLNKARNDISEIITHFQETEPND
jgi:uncharacterized protein with HEPN domain